VNDGYVYDPDDFSLWMQHVNRFPITSRYQKLQAYYHGDIGEGGDAVLARLLTASDCGDDRVREFLGKGMDEPFGMELLFVFSKTDYVKTVDLTKENGYACTEKVDAVNCRFDNDGATRSLLKIKPYVDQIKDLFEQG